MKLFSYLLVACAGLGLFACNTENDPVIENGDGVTKSVSLKLNGISGSLNTKAIEAGTTSTSTEAIILKDLKIVFYDKTATNGPIYRTVVFDPVANSTEWAALTGTGDGYVFHNLDPKVTSVLIVGNWQGKGGTVASPTTNINWANVSSIKSSVLLAAEENQSVPNLETTPTNSTKNYVTLWGEADLVSGGTFVDSTHPTGAVVSKYTAAVTIKPLVARMEIGNIQCDNLGTMYSEFYLKGIGLIEMFLENSIDGTGKSDRLMIDTHILEPGSAPLTGKYVFGTDANLAWAFDAIYEGGTPPNFVLINNLNDIYNPNGTSASPSGNLKFAYNFFPEAEFPNIKLLLHNVKTVGGGLSGFNYVATASFEEDDANHPLAGYIYKVDLKFKEINIGPWNPDNFICVIVKVTVTPWTIMSLTPVFH